jgi:hypothetical protein
MLKTFMMKKRKVRLGVSRSVGQEGGFGPSSFNLVFHSVLVKIYLGKSYHLKALVLLFQLVFSIFHGRLFLAEKNRFEKKMNPVRRGLVIPAKKPVSAYCCRPRM